MVDAAARFLFQCPHHGGIRRTSQLVIFPTCSGKPATPAEPDTEDQASIAGSAAISGTKRPRAEGGASLESLRGAIEEEEQAYQAEQAAAPTPPAKKKQLATSVSVITQVSAIPVRVCDAAHRLSLASSVFSLLLSLSFRVFTFYGKSHAVFRQPRFFRFSGEGDPGFSSGVTSPCGVFQQVFCCSMGDARKHSNLIGCPAPPYILRVQILLVLSGGPAW
ncbi:unnamed protein product [Scytosiphon promiscuus]